MNLQEARQAVESDRARLMSLGISWENGAEPTSYLPDGWGSDVSLAVDAQPTIQLTPSSGIPWIFTTTVDPTVYHILFAPNKAAVIFGEQRKGSWVDDTIAFPTVEAEGEVSSYGDGANNGMVSVNANWPMRQSYLFQVIKKYGEREVARAGAAKLNWIAEIDRSAATQLNKFSDLTYFFGSAGVQNYGLLNDPNLGASLTPIAKSEAGQGTLWFNATTGVFASPTEVYADIQFMVEQMVIQTAGLVDAESKMVLVVSPGAEVALASINSFGVNVHKMLKENFPNMRIETAVQYGKLSTANPQGVSAGNFAQLIVEEIEGQDTGYMAFNEKMREFAVVRELSAWKQKAMSGTWGAIIRMPFAIVSMVGI